MKRLLALGLLSLLLSAAPARAAFHVMQIEQVIGGANSDDTAQAIQLRMRSPGQKFITGAKLMAYDAKGQNGVLLIAFPSDVAASSLGSRILITSASFSSLTASPLPSDFTLTNLIPASYLAAGRLVYTDSTGGVLWSLSFGGASYTGASTGSTTNDSDGNFGPPFAGPLPDASTQAILFQGSASSLSTTNVADYALTAGAATFTNNAGASASLGPPPATLPKITRGTARVGLRSAAAGLVSPIDLVTANDGSGRLFIAEQTGQIRILKSGQLLPGSLLDLASRLVTLDPGYDERGLLGLAFHPGFSDATSPGYRKLYTYTSEPVSGTADFTVSMTGTPDHQSVLAEWQVSGANPDVVDPATRREVLRVDKPQSNHNGGKLAFRSTDGYLYLSLGDGGNANDVGDGHGATGNGQNINTVLGKILRLDPLAPALTPGSADAASANGKYRVPTTNPFVGKAGTDEIFAYGLRNPFRFCFDNATNVDRLLVGDVGQDHVEEVDVVELGKNYGWHLKEGSFLFNPATAAISVDPNPDPSLINPVLEYGHDDGLAVLGGFVYRGTALSSDLAGQYLFGDLSKDLSAPAGRLFYGDLDLGTIKELSTGFDNGPLRRFVKGFGRDANGEVYLLASQSVGPSGTTGQVLQIVPLSQSLTALGDTVPNRSEAKYSRFSTPGAGAFAGELKVGAAKTAAVFATDGSVSLSVGAGAPGIFGSALATLGTPSGDAVKATLKVGVGDITSGKSSLLLTGLSTGAARVAAQSGVAETGLPAGVTIKSFGAIDGNGSATFFLATLQGTKVTAKNASALCAALPDGSVKVLLRTQDVVGGRAVAVISTLTGSASTLAEGRWRVNDTTLGVRLTFADAAKSQALYVIPAGASSPADWTLLAATGPADSVAATISSFGLPGFGPSSFAVLAHLSTTPADNVAILTGPIGGAVKLLRRKGEPIAKDASGQTLTNVAVKSLSDPVVGAGGNVAYLLTTTKPSLGSGIEYALAGANPKLLGNAGAAAPGGGHWFAFKSLALPDGLGSGPLFTASLAVSAADSVTSQSNLGLWGVDSTGALGLLFRRHQPAIVSGATKTVDTFTALVPAPGSIGAANGYDNAGNVSVLATFTDHTSALLRLAVP